jgi:hypothetical protein
MNQDPSCGKWGHQVADSMHTLKKKGHGVQGLKRKLLQSIGQNCAHQTAAVKGTAAMAGWWLPWQCMCPPDCIVAVRVQLLLRTCLQMHLHTTAVIRRSPRTFRRCLDHCSAPASSSGEHTYRHLDFGNPSAAAAAGSTPFAAAVAVAPPVREVLGQRLRIVADVAAAAGDDMPPGAPNLRAVAKSLFADLD